MNGDVAVRQPWPGGHLNGNVPVWWPEAAVDTVHPASRVSAALITPPAHAHAHASVRGGGGAPTEQLFRVT